MNLAGKLEVWPGRAAPGNLHSTRRPWAERVAPGQQAKDLPSIVASLFSLCGEAHRCASLLALSAASPDFMFNASLVAKSLQRESALEHLRRICLDWPRLLAPSADRESIQDRAIGCLRRCPLFSQSDQPAPWEAVQQWLESEWLAMPAQEWLLAFDSDRIGCLHRWSQTQPDCWLRKLFRASSTLDLSLPLVPPLRLDLSDPQSSLGMLGRELRSGSHFSSAPHWLGESRCTGPWTRRHLAEDYSQPSPWLQLGLRLAEVVRLCLPDSPRCSGSQWLDWGLYSHEPLQGIAWVEMSRGVLIHQVALEPRDLKIKSIDCWTVRSCQVLAPTEWNFHPEGVAARALAKLPKTGTEASREVNLLMAALDPCVEFTIAGADTLKAQDKELHHA